MNKKIEDIFVKNLKEILKQKELTQKELSKLLNKGDSTVSRWILKEVSPNLRSIEDMANALEVELVELLSNINEFKPKKLPILGDIAAGKPILAEDNIDGYFDIDGSIDADFCLRIKGDSMIDSGISDGDLVFIRQQDSIENGEIGAVLVLDELSGQMVATLKKIKIKGNIVQLIPSNENLKTLEYPINNVKIAGKLVGMYRNYK